MANLDLTLHWERLLSLRATLSGNMARMEDEALNGHARTASIPTDDAELGSDSFDQELTLSLLGSEKDALHQIDGALKRIKDGTFGQCEQCGVKIPEPRLEAIPYATRCVHCASQQEEGH